MIFKAGDRFTVKGRDCVFTVATVYSLSLGQIIQTKEKYEIDSELLIPHAFMVSECTLYNDYAEEDWL